MKYTTLKSLEAAPEFINLSTGNRKLKNTDNVGFLIFNLPAVVTCPYATESCKALCYAKKAERIYPTAREARKNNFNIANSGAFVDRMVFSILGMAATKYKNKKQIVVRIHESGDFYNEAYANKWLEIASRCASDNRIVFMAYTKSVKYFIEKSIPENMTIRFSLWDDTKPEQIAMADSLKLPTYSAADAVTVSEKVAAGSCEKCDCTDCGNCRKCWDKNINSIYCVIH